MSNKLRLVGKTKRELTNLVSMQQQAVFALDTEGYLIYLNQVAEQLFGCSASDLSKQSFTQTLQVHDNNGPLWPGTLLGHADYSQGITAGSASFVDSARRKHYFAYVTVPVIEHEQLTGLTVLCTPLAGVDSDMHALHLLQEVAAHSSQPLITFSVNGQVGSVNRSAQQKLGYSRDQINEVGGMSALFVEAQALESYLLAIQSARQWQASLALQDHAGAMISAQLHLMPVLNPVGEVLFFACSCGDLLDSPKLPAVQEGYQQMIEQADSLIIRLDSHGMPCFINDYAQMLLEPLNRAQQLEFLINKVLPGEVSEPLIQGAEKGSIALNSYLPTPAGLLLPLIWSIKPLHNEQQQFDGLLCIANINRADNDITQEPQHYYQRAMLTMQQINEGVIGLNQHGEIEYLNPVAERLTGCVSREVYGKPMIEVFKACEERSGQPVEGLVWRVLRTGEALSDATECLLKRYDESDLLIHFSCLPMKSASGSIEGAVLLFEDITERRGIERQLMYQSSHDALTGLLNRRELETQLAKVINQSRRTSQCNALLVMDLDQFKVINDTCGHVAGDVLLKQFSALLQGVFKALKNVLLARMGGDEFGVLLYEMDQPAAQRMAQQICEAVEQFRFTWFERSYRLGISIGIASVGGDSGSMAEVLSAAESSCYLAKERGRNAIHTYSADDSLLNQRRGEMQWLHRINRALKEGSFCLYHQKILPLSSYRFCGYPHSEILVRMVDEQGQLIGPASFIAAAERYQLMADVDRWVVNKVFNTLRVDGNSRQQSFSINLSGQTLSDENVLDYVVEQTKQREISPDKICFEITETAAINNVPAAQRFIHELKNMGFHFALDDFGSGMSSFAYLKELPVDYLKIDGGFVCDMLKDPTNFALVESINNMGHAMGVQTIAEYVEDDATLQRLWELGVDHVQGFCMAKPVPLWQSLRSD